MPRLGLRHHRLVAEGDIPAQECGAPARLQLIEPAPETRHGMERSRAVAGSHLDVQRQAGIGHEGAVITMRRASGLLRVVADHGALLFAVERFHRRIEIADPGRGEQGSCGATEMMLKPSHPVGFIDAIKRASGGVFRDELPTPEERWMYLIVLHRTDVGVTEMTGQDREHQRREHFALGGRMVALEGGWTVLDEGIKESAHFEKLDEKGQLSERRDGRGWIPAHMHPTAERIERDRLR